MDRESAFSDDDVVQLLSARYVPVAPSLTEIIKSRDTAGDFFRKVAEQRPEPKHTKQGYYICSPDGTLIKGWMYPRPDDGAMKRYLKEALASYRPPRKVEALDDSKVDRQCNPEPPDGAVVVDVRARLLEAKWGPSPAQRVDMIRDATGHDRMWILRSEAQAVARGTLPDSLLERIIRFHLVDNTRGVPSRWRQDDIQIVQVGLAAEKGRFRLEGRVRMAVGDDRRFDAHLFGYIEPRGDTIARFDLVVRGRHATKKAEVGEAPTGDATLGIAFAMAEPGEWSRVVPLYTWDLADYLRTDRLRVTELRKNGSPNR